MTSLTQEQIWLTVVLDLKRASRYLYLGAERKADFFINEARTFVDQCDLTVLPEKVRSYIDLDRKEDESVLETAEKWLLSATILSIKAYKVR